MFFLAYFLLLKILLYEHYFKTFCKVTFIGVVSHMFVIKTINTPKEQNLNLFTVVLLVKDSQKLKGIVE